eukprot:g17937.t1
MDMIIALHIYTVVFLVFTLKNVWIPSLARRKCVAVCKLSHKVAITVALGNIETCAPAGIEPELVEPFIYLR